MSNHVTGHSKMSQGVGIVLSGVGIGCLMGLSISPVVGIVVTSVVGAVAAVVTALSGLEGKTGALESDSTKSLSRLAPSVWPLVLLIMGLVVGAAIGISARNNHWFGSDASSEITKWTQLGIEGDEARDRLFDTAHPNPPQMMSVTETTAIIDNWIQLGLSKEVVAQRLFDRAYPISETTSVSNQNTPITLTGLYSQEAAEDCVNLLAAIARAKSKSDDQEVILAIKTASSASLRKLVDISQDATILRRLIEDIICVKN
jgi:hypothetical protein